MASIQKKRFLETTIVEACLQLLEESGVADNETKLQTDLWAVVKDILDEWGDN